jgi:Mlc titration factor MtfA (ptsG expression regulator)
MWFLKVASISFLLYHSGKAYGWVTYLFTKNHYDLLNVKRRYRKREPELEAMLEDKFHYFKHLSKAGRYKLMARLWKVYHKAEFFGHQGLEITEEMKLCVLFSKIQLTYGLDLFHFKRFKKYILYPETFYSRFFERELKGLTSGVGFITLSWADFEEGYLVHNDKFNLGLHEMAHALRLELEWHDNYRSKTDKYSNLFDHKAIAEMNLMERDVPTVLRDYAQTNDEEFFAVCVEYFFEAPDLLKDLKPEIFDTLSKMLNQNPMNKENDYSLIVSTNKSDSYSGGQRAADV